MDEYAHRWEVADRRWIGQYKAEDVRHTLWPWLEERRYAAGTDDEVLEYFLAILGRRPAHLRPGLRLHHRWDADAVRALAGSGELAATIRRAVNAVFSAADEPKLPVRSIPGEWATNV